MIRTWAHNQRNDNDKQTLNDEEDALVVVSNDRSNNGEEEDEISVNTLSQIL